MMPTIIKKPPQSSEDYIDIVKYDNAFMETNISVLSEAEQDILMTICATFDELRCMKQDLPYLTIREKARITNVSGARFQMRLQNFVKKITKLYFFISAGGDSEAMPLFKRIKTVNKRQVLEIELNECFAHYFFQIPDRVGFSQFLLGHFLNVHSKYAKVLFREFRQRYQEYWKVPINELREVLGVPKSLTNPALVRSLTRDWLPDLEACGMFQHITMEVHYARTPGRPIDRIDFSYRFMQSAIAKLHGQKELNFEGKFTPVEHEEIHCTQKLQPAKNMIGPPEVIEIKEKVMVKDRCPKCGAQLYEFTAKDGIHRYRCCENTKFPAFTSHFQNGNHSCDYYAKAENVKKNTEQNSSASEDLFPTE